MSRVSALGLEVVKLNPGTSSAKKAEARIKTLAE